MKERSYYEKENRATPSEPFLDDNMTNINFISHFHEEIEIIYVVAGSITLCVDGRIYNANCGDIGIIMPGEIHSYSSMKSHVYVLKIASPNYSENLQFSLLRLKNSVITKNSDCTYAEAKRRILDLFNEYQNKKTGYKIAINLHSLEFLLFIVRNLEYEIVSVELNKKISNRMLLLKTVNEYIENNYAKTITLEDIAKYCGYSLYYFAHYFKETTKTSFVDYLSTFRAEKARKLLLISDKKITDIANECGFRSIRTFNRVFKNQFQLSPREYKKISVG